MKKTLRSFNSSLRRQSDKTRQNEILWYRIKLYRLHFLTEKYGRAICEYCGRPSWGNELGHLDAHHINGNHKNSTEDNCYICHRVCHDEIKRLRLKVKPLGFEGIKRGVDDE